MLRRTILGFTLALFAGAPAYPHAGEVQETGQHAQKFEKNGVKLDYLLYLPPDYIKNTDKKWPLIVFLHGSGERGTNVNDVKKHGPPKIVGTDESPLKGRFVVVSPQCPPKEGWKSAELNPLLDSIMADYRIDPDRVYLTGLSMGGFGTWSWAIHNPERFAAIAPMCGGGDASRADRLKNVPIWVFHGEKDPTVKIQRDEEMVDAVKKAGNKDVKFTRYPDLGHDCWTVSYANPELYDWLLEHQRSGHAKSASSGK